MFREAAYNAMMAELVDCAGDIDAHQELANLFADFYAQETQMATPDRVQQYACAAGVMPEHMVEASIRTSVRFFLRGVAVGASLQCQ